ncbi:hypothetical protein B0H13DRAFT_2383946 [Mycena leptocephala]|nr:hypothetical protein B0H13DRAFT_2383946 [Mycena leptocephala]
MLPPVLLVLLHARRTLTLYILNRNQHPSPDVDAPLPPAQFLGVQDELGVGNRPVIDGGADLGRFRSILTKSLFTLTLATGCKTASAL